MRRECDRIRTCAPGTYMATDATPKTNRECFACPVGRYQGKPNQAGNTAGGTACIPLSWCGPGQHVKEVGSSTSDRTCSPCPGGTYMPQPKHSNTACFPVEDCRPGTRMVADYNVSTDRVCAPCPPYSFQGKQNQPACQPQRVCPSGQRVLFIGSVVADLTCTPCASGKFQPDPATRVTQCQQHTECAPGSSFVGAKAGATATSDRVCRSCAPNTFQRDANQPTCLDHAYCGAGKHVDYVGSTVRPTIFTRLPHYIAPMRTRVCCCIAPMRTRVCCCMRWLYMR